MHTKQRNNRKLLPKKEVGIKMAGLLSENERKYLLGIKKELK